MEIGYKDNSLPEGYSYKIHEEMISLNGGPLTLTYVYKIKYDGKIIHSKRLLEEILFLPPEEMPEVLQIINDHIIQRRSDKIDSILKNNKKK